MMNVKRSPWVLSAVAMAALAGACKSDRDPGMGDPSKMPPVRPITTQPMTKPATRATTAEPVAALPTPGPAAAAIDRGWTFFTPSSQTHHLTPPATPPARPGAALADASAIPPAIAIPPNPNLGADPVGALPTDAPRTAPTVPPQTNRVPGWYQWRGPEQNGVSREKNLPSEWSPDGKNLLWTSDVGAMSSPVIWNGKLYTYGRIGEVSAGAADYPTLTPGPKTQEVLVCVNIKDGKVLWKTAKNMTQTEVPFHRLGWSSPCVDPSSGRVYGLGSQCTLECVDGETGKVIWDRQMTEEFGLISTFGGRTPAPSLDEDQLFIAGISFGWGDHARGQHRIFAFNKNTGELNWSAPTGGLPVDAPQNTPVVTVINGQRLVIFAAGDGGIHAFQARTGKKVWSHKVSKRGLNTSVVIDGEHLYCSHDLDNLDTRTSSELGRIFCLDIAHLENGSPKELWKITGIEAGFPSPCVTDKWLYIVDDRAKLYQIDKVTGKIAWKKTIGNAGKPSPVYADGKLYVTDGNGRFTILKPGETAESTKVLSKVDLPEKLGREYATYGSIAIADGRVYLQTATKIFCIGNKGEDGKEAARTPDEQGPIPALTDEKPVAKDAPAFVQVTPFDATLRPGQSAKFTARSFDANGDLIGVVPADQVKWSVAQLTIPAPPPRPSMRKPDAPATQAAANAEHAAAVASAKPTAETPDAARTALIAATTQPTTGPTKAGNLKGDVAADGTFTAQAGPPQGGAVQATVGALTGETRVRVFPPLPWSYDFQQAPVGKPPLTFLGAGGKFAVVEDPDDPKNKALQKLLDIDLYYKARVNFGTEDLANYTLQADIKVNEKIAAERHYLPDAGIIDSRYVLLLNGDAQTLQIHIWPAALPDERNPNGALQSTMPFTWQAKKWYRLKLEVIQEKDAAVARGKAWPAGEPEPAKWMLDLRDEIPNRNGNPGLYGNSLVTPIKSEIYYDNILVTPTDPAASASAPAKAENTQAR